MIGSLKRMARLKSKTSEEAPPPPPAAPPANASDGGAPATPNRRSNRRRSGGGGINPPTQGPGNGDPESFSVLLMGVEKNPAHFRAIHRMVEESLLANCSFVPKAIRIVERIEFCRHPSGDGHFAVVVFRCRVMAELLLAIHRSNVVDFPFAAPGKRVSMELSHKSGDLARTELLGKKPMLYVSGIANGWGEPDKLRERFEEILRDNSSRSDLEHNLVKKIQVSGCSALIGFKSKAEVDLLMYKCSSNRAWLEPLGGDQIIMVSAKADAGFAEETPARVPGSPPPRAPAADMLNSRQLCAVPAPAPAPVDADRREAPAADAATRDTPRDSLSRELGGAPAPDVRREKATLPVPPADAAKYMPRDSHSRQLGGAPAPVPMDVDRREEATLQAPPADAVNRDMPRDSHLRQPGGAPAPMDVERREKAGVAKLDMPKARPSRLSPTAPAPAPMDADQRENTSTGRRPGSSGAAPEPPKAGVEQRLLYLSSCDLVNFNRLKLEALITRALGNANGVPEDRSFQLVVDINSGWPQLIFDSPAAADSLMSYYVSHTDKFHLEDFPFALIRHKLYSRPGASYRQHRGFTRGMSLMLSGLRGLRVHEILLQGAVSEAVEKLLAESGTLVRGSPALESLVQPPGLDCAVISLEETIGTTLQSAANNFLLAGRMVKVQGLGSDQSTLILQNLPTIQDKYNASTLRSIIMYILQKHRPDLATGGCISELCWPACNSKGHVVFSSEAVSDALMDTYVAHTDDFCKQELVFTIYRHPRYIRPGTVLSRDISPRPVVRRELMMTGLQESLNPIPLRGAVVELLDRALAGTGVLKQPQGMSRKFFYLKGSSAALLTVEEAVAKELVGRPGLVLAGQNVEIINSPMHRPPPAFNHPFFPPPPPPPPLWNPSDLPAGTGGWIEPDDV